MTPAPNNNCAACGCACGTREYCEGSRCRNAFRRGQRIPTACGAPACESPLLPGRDPRFRFVCSRCEPVYGKQITRWPSEKVDRYLAEQPKRPDRWHREHHVDRGRALPRHLICSCTAEVAVVDELGDPRCVACGRYRFCRCRPGTPTRRDVAERCQRAQSNPKLLEQPLAGLIHRWLSDDRCVCCGYRRDMRLQPVHRGETGYLPFERTFRSVAGEPPPRRGTGGGGVVDDEDGGYVAPSPSPWLLLHDGGLRTRCAPEGTELPRTKIRTCCQCGAGVKAGKKSMYRNEPRCDRCDAIDREYAGRFKSGSTKTYIAPFQTEAKAQEELHGFYLKRHADKLTVPRDPVMPNPADEWDRAGGDRRGADDILDSPVRQLPVPSPDVEMAVAA